MRVLVIFFDEQLANAAMSLLSNAISTLDWLELNILIITAASNGFVL